MPLNWTEPNCGNPIRRCTRAQPPLCPSTVNEYIAICPTLLGPYYNVVSTTIQILPLHSQCIKAPCQALHRVADSFEHPHATGPALDMLTQPAQRDKLSATVLVLFKLARVVRGRFVASRIAGRKCQFSRRC